MNTPAAITEGFHVAPGIVTYVASPCMGACRCCGFPVLQSRLIDGACDREPCQAKRQKKRPAKTTPR